jgi:EpsI family protein
VLGAWEGVELAPDSEVETLYAHPDLVMRREYADPSGRLIWLTAIGSRGPKSYSLFEHTPAICYASSGWSTIAEDTVVISLRQGTIALHRGVYNQGQEQRVVYSWYQWDDAERDAARGATSWRVATDAGDGLDAAQSRLDGFLAILFHEVLPWHRF